MGWVIDRKSFWGSTISLTYMSKSVGYWFKISVSTYFILIAQPNLNVWFDPVYMLACIGVRVHFIILFILNILTETLVFDHLLLFDQRYGEGGDLCKCFTFAPPLRCIHFEQACQLCWLHASCDWLHASCVGYMLVVVVMLAASC